MKRNFLVTIFAIVGILIYIFVINIIANSFSISGAPITERADAMYDTGEVRLGFSDTVKVTVERNRWYGTIIENSGQETKSVTLYLLNLIALPLQAGGISFLLIHLIFLILLVLSLYFFANKLKKNDFERGFA